MDAILIPAFIIFCLVIPVLLLCLLLYAVPARAAITLVRNGETQEERLFFSWGFFGARISGTGTQRTAGIQIGKYKILSISLPKDAVTKEPDMDQIAHSTRPREIKEMLSVLQRLVTPIKSFVSVFWRESRFEGADGRVRLGLDNPVLTGEICGIYWASRFIFLASRINIELEPVFDRPIFDFDLTARMRVEHPLFVLFAGLQVVTQPAIRKVIPQVIGEKQGVAGT